MLDQWLPEKGFGFLLIGIVFLIGLVVITVRAIVRSYRRQHAVDHVLISMLDLSKSDFFTKMNELGFFSSNRLCLSGKMGTGIASQKTLVQILYQYLAFQPNQTDEVVWAALEHFEQHKPLWRRLLWPDSSTWEWGETRSFITKIHSLFNPDEEDEIATRYDLLRALDQILLRDRLEWVKQKTNRQNEAKQRRQDKYWLLAKKVLHRPEPPVLVVLPETKQIPASADTLP